MQLLDDQDAEVVYRSLVALGNIVRALLCSRVALHSSVTQQLLSKSAGSLAIGAVQGAREKAQQASRRVPEKRIKDVTTELLAKVA